MAPARESVIQAAICDYLATRKIFFWRMNNIPVFDGGRFRSLPKYTPRGLPDIVVVHKGSPIFLEVKNEKGKLSEAQRDFGDAAHKAGAVYEVVRSIDDVVRLHL